MDDVSLTISMDSEFIHKLSARITGFREQRKFTDCREYEKFTDCRIIVGAETIECHANIISAFSPVIERMLDTPMKEGVSKELTFHTIQPQVMKIILDYMYTGTATVHKTFLRETVQTCDFLHLLELKNKILPHIRDTLSPGNVIGWLQTARLLNLDHIYRRCKHILAASFKQVIQEREFKDLEYSELVGFLHEMSHTNASQGSLLEAVLVWVEVDVMKRVQSLDDAVSYIKLAKCSKSALDTIMKDYESILIQSPRTFETLRQVLEEMTASPMQVTMSAIMFLVIIGGFDNKTCWTVESNRKYREITRIPDDVFSYWHSICLYDGVGLILTGGYQNVCAMYHAATSKWRNMKKLRFSRDEHASACLLGELYVLGGFVSGYRSTSVDCLNIEDPDEDWKSIAKMPAVLHWPKLAQSGTKVYVLGNCDPKLYSFDASRKIWGLCATLPQNPGWGFSMAGGGGRIFAVGGDKHICCIYAPECDSWVLASKPALDLRYGALVFHQDKLVSLGGYCDDIEEYDVAKDKWEIAPYKLPEKLQFHFAFSMDIPE